MGELSAMHVDVLECPRCGEEVYPEDTACYACGASLGGGPVGEGQLDAGLPADGRTPQNPYLTSPRFDTPVRPQLPPIGEGFFERLRRGRVFMRQCLAMWGKDEDLPVPSILSFLTLAGFYISCYLLLRHYGLWQTGVILEQPRLPDYAVVAPIVLGGYLISYFYTGMTISLVDVYLRGGDADVAEAFRRSLRSIGAVLALAVGSTLADTLGRRGARAGGAVGVLATVFGAGWYSATYLILPAVVIGQMPLPEAVRRGRALDEEHFPDLFLTDIGLLLVNRIITITALVLGIGQGVALYFLADPELLGIAVTAGLTLISFAFILTTYLRSACYACLYDWAVAIEDTGRAMPAPAPLAEAIAIA